MTENNDNNAVAVQEQPAVMFEVAILDIKEAVRLTPEIIREKSKALTSLVIKDIFDEAGYKAVKNAKALAVKTRTSIEKLETAKNKELKADFEKKKKAVTDYTTELYAACREVENVLQGKLTAIDDAKAEAARKLEEAREAKTTQREGKMYDLGMTWNGRSFVGYGKFLDKQFLFDLPDDAYEELVVELSGLQMQAGMTGQQQEPVAPIQQAVAFPAGGAAPIPSEPWKPFDNTIYERHIPEHGVHLFITNGEVADHPAACVLNDEINKSGYFVQVISR